MKKNYLFNGIIVCFLSMIFSCGTSDNSITVCDVIPVSTYDFTVDGSSTVAYPGQTNRLAMANEMSGKLASSGVTLGQLTDMWTNTDGANGTYDWDNNDIDGSTQYLENKVAKYQQNASDITTWFETDIFATYVSEVEPIISGDVTTHPASVGVAGWVADLDGSDDREVDGLGRELDQVFAKSLIGALCLDEIAHGYLADIKLLDANNTDRNPNEDANSTNMEHYWDEGFGYAYGGEPDPLAPTYTKANDPLLGYYLGKYPTEAGYVYSAFCTGRQAIVQGCYDERDRQSDIVRDYLSKVVGDKAVHYLNSAITKANSQGDRGGDFFHALSEAYGFIHSLQYTYNPATGASYYSYAEVNQLLGELDAGSNVDGNGDDDGLWGISLTRLQEMHDEIIARGVSF